MNTEELNDYLKKVEPKQYEELIKANEFLLKIINEKKLKNRLNIDRYRKKEENKQLIKDISKKSYNKVKDDPEKYQSMLDKKKLYYQQNKAKIQEKNKLKYNVVKQLLTEHKQKDEQKEQ